MLPLMAQVASEIRNGEFGTWSRVGGCGTDLFAMLGTLDLDLLGFVVFPSWLAYGLLMLIQRLVAAYFTFRVFREQLRLKTLPSLYGGLAYSLFAQGWFNRSGGGFTLYHGLSVAGFPFFLWALVWIRGQRPLALRYLLSAGLGLLIALTSSYAFQVFFFVAAILWYAVLYGDFGKSLWPSFGVVVLTWGISELPLVIPAALNAGASHRAVWAIGSLPTQTFREIVRLLGAYWDNWLPVLIGATAIAVARTRPKYLARLASLAAGTSLIVVAAPAVQEVVKHILPPLGGFQLDRLYMALPFFLIAFGSTGLDSFGDDWQIRLAHRSGRFFNTPAATLVALAAIVSVGLTSVDVKRTHIKEATMGHNWSMLYDRPEYSHLVQLGTRSGQPFRVGVIVDNAVPTLQPSMLWPAGLETPGGYLRLYSQAYHSFWQLVLSPSQSLPGSRFSYFRGWGSRIYLFLPLQFQGDGSPLIVGRYFDMDLLSLANVKYVVSPHPLNGDGLIQLEFLSGVSDPEDPHRSTLGRLRRMLFQGVRYARPIFLYENTQVLPRAFLAGQVKALTNDSEVSKALGEMGRDDFLSYAFVGDGDIPDFPENDSGLEGTVQVEQIKHSRLSIFVNTTKPALLVVGNTFSPYWRAKVNGKLLEVMRVDLCFQGVVVPPGESLIEMWYEPNFGGKNIHRENQFVNW